MAYLTIWQDRGIHMRYFGRVSDREIGELVEKFQADARYDAVRYILHDFRGIDSLSFTHAAIEELSAKDAAAALSKRKHRVAVVGALPEVEAMIRVYLDTGLHREDKLRIFSDLETARNWACA
jgi:hypothetical protein